MEHSIDYEPRALSFDLPHRGGRMAVLDFGPEDRPVDIVFSHAVGFNARTYRTVLAPLASELRIFALDLRGHGASTLPVAEIGRRGLAADLVELLSAATERRVVLAGHSMGAATSILAAHSVPERVSALVLFEPALNDRSSAATDIAWQAAAQKTLRRRAIFPDRAAAVAAYAGRGVFTHWSSAQLADYVAAGFCETPGGEVALVCSPEWEAALYAPNDQGVLDALDAAHCPVLIFAAETKSTVGEEARTIARKRGFRLEITAGTTHSLPLERPELVQQVLSSVAAADRKVMTL
jgi:pimeloyl-ACP methyl ester carboxylesterase